MRTFTFGIEGAEQLPQRERRRVWVLLEDGRRVEGWLEAWRKDQEGWRGFVRYSTGLAESRLGWFSEERLSPVERRASVHRTF